MRNYLGLLIVPILLAPIVASAAPSRIDAAAFGAGAVLHAFPDQGDTLPAGLSQLGGLFDQGATWGVDADPGFNTLLFDTLTLTLDVPVEAIAFMFGSNRLTDVTVTVGRQGTAGADFQLLVGGDDQPADGVGNWVFHGFSDPDGIDTLTFSRNLLAPGLYSGIGQLLTMGSVQRAAAVPEPMGMTLFGAGLAGLLLVRSRAAKRG